MKRKNFLVKFFKDLKKEINQIVWPSRKEVLNKTYLVVGVSLVLTLLVFALDALYAFGLNEVLEKFM